MIWIFVAALVLGGGLIVASLLGHDADLPTDAPHTVDVVADAGLLTIFSLRNFTWASFAFGGFGLLAVLTHRSPAVTWISAAAAGLGTLLAVHVVFSALRRTEAGETPLDIAAIGAHATLVLPFNEDGIGVVRFLSNGQVMELPARRAPDVGHWDGTESLDCRIEYIADGMAVVTPA